MAAIDGNTLEGVSATTLWTLHNRATEAARPGGQLPGVHAARDIPHIPGRGVFKWLAWSPLDRIGPSRRRRPGLTVLDFASARPADAGR